jgi:hypothetical protein
VRFAQFVNETGKQRGTRQPEEDTRERIRERPKKKWIEEVEEDLRRIEKRNNLLLFKSVYYRKF